MADLDSTLLEANSNFKTAEQPQILIPTMNREESSLHDPPTQKGIASSKEINPAITEEIENENNNVVKLSEKEIKKPIKITSEHRNEAYNLINTKSAISIRPSENDNFHNEAPNIKEKDKIIRKRIATSQGNREPMPVKVTDLNSMV